MTVANTSVGPSPSVAAHADQTSRWPVTVRVLCWIVVWASALRMLTAVIGLWAAGRLGLVNSFLIGAVIPGWLFICAPTWLTFRLPLRLRARWLVRLGCWLSPLCRLRDIASVDIFVRADAGQPLPPVAQLPADAWTALAVALQASRSGDPARAGRIIDGLLHMPGGSPVPLLARVHAVEALMRPAFARRDWGAIRVCARLGRGRWVALLDLLARGHLGEAVDGRELWWRWALAPGRRKTFVLVRALARRQRATAPAVIPPPAAGALTRRGVDGSAERAAPHLRHLHLLAAVARGDLVTASDVFALAGAWESHLDGAALARVQAGALVLDVRDGAAQAQRLRDEVLGDLTFMAAAADGALPATVTGSLGAELARRIRDQRLGDIERALRTLLPGQQAPALPPLQAWERWLEVTAAVDRAEQQLGEVAVTTAWHSGLRNALWTWTCVLFNRDPWATAWVSHAMFCWLADRAERLGDLATVVSNRENAAAARRAAA